MNEQLDNRLVSDELSERMDAGRALRAAANDDLELVVSHEVTFISFLFEESGALRLSEAVSIVKLVGIDLNQVSSLVPQFVDVLKETVAPAIEEAVIRSLTRIGMADPKAVADADLVVVERLLDATSPTQTVITRLFVGVVREEPHRFDETIPAYVTLIQSEPKRTVRFAAEALAEVTLADSDRTATARAGTRPHRGVGSLRLRRSATGRRNGNQSSCSDVAQRQNGLTRATYRSIRS